MQLTFGYLDGGLPGGVNVWDGSEFDYYYLAYDQVGSLRYVFDEAGSLAKAVTYDAFGNVLSDSNPSLKLPLGFAGGHADHDTGLVRFVARDYDPEIGRWTAGDPLGVQGGLNPYLYVGNNPVNLTDPYGLAPGLLDRIHDGLGVLGLVPVFGIFAEGGALVISVIQLDGTGVLIDGLSMVPWAGGAVRGGQLAYKAGKVVAKNADEAADLTKVFSRGSGGTPQIGLGDASDAASRNGIDMRMIELRYESGPNYGYMSYTGSGKLVRGDTGKIVVTLQDAGLVSEKDAVETIAHELNHIRGVMRSGDATSEAVAESAGESAGKYFR